MVGEDTEHGGGAVVPQRNRPAPPVAAVPWGTGLTYGLVIEPVTKNPTRHKSTGSAGNRNTHLYAPIRHKDTNRSEDLSTQCTEQYQDDRDDIAEAEHHQHAVGERHLRRIQGQDPPVYPPTKKDHPAQPDETAAQDPPLRIACGEAIRRRERHRHPDAE